MAKFQTGSARIDEIGRLSEGYSMSKTGLIVLALVGVVGILAVLVWAGLLILSPVSFCDLVAILDAALTAGEAVLDAIRDFLDANPAELVDGLPEDAQGPARVLISVAQAAVRGSGIGALAGITSALLEPVATAVRAMTVVCNAL